MSSNTPVFNLKRLKGYADWQLLLFLFLFLNVKLVIKIPAIILIYLLRPNFQFKFSLKNSRLPFFYPLIILIAIADLVINKNYSTPNYLPVLLTGIGFWVVCILTVHQVKLAVERNDTEVIHRTIVVFFIINAIISLLNLAYIVWITGAINPYNYQGEYQKYFVSTGDYVKGITFDTSTTNAVLNGFGVIYFFTKKMPVMLLICMAILLLTGSNFTNVILFGILAYFFIFKSSRDQKSLLVVCMVFLAVFMAKISPQNNDYLINTIKIIIYQKNVKSPWPQNPIPVTQRPDSSLTPEEKKEKIAMLYIDSVHSTYKKPVIKTAVGTVMITDAGKIIIPKPDLNAPIYQNLGTTPPEQKQLADFIKTHKAELPISGKPNHFTAIPGKVTSLLQTLNFFKQHPGKIITGAGTGNFSSKIAFKATGLKFTGGYPAKYVYINPNFLKNHLDVYLNFFSKGASLHSLTNSPFSVYDQMLAEYGLLGLLALFIFYLGFFAKSYKYLTYGIPLLVFMMAILFIDYWFEQLSVMVMFELMLFLNIRESEVLIVNPVKS